jgi:hypothetical protein
MFQKAVRRFTLGALLVVSVAALAAATGGSASVGFVTTNDTPSVDGNNVACPGFGVNERHYCLVITTYNNLKQGGAVEVDLTLKNYDSSTLTNPSATLTWDNSVAKLSFISSNPANCSSASANSATCTFPNIPGVGSGAGGGSFNASTVKLYFGSAADSAATIHFGGTATAKENGNDNTGAANVETQTVLDAAMTFDSNTGDAANEDATVVLPTAPFNKPRLHTTLGNAFVGGFTSTSPAFIAQFAATSGTPCLLGVSCTGLDLNTDLSGGSFSATNQILWTADVTANNTNIVAVHTYDPVSITPSAPNTLTTTGTRFANCDGVVFTSFGTNPQANLSTGTAYFVRNPTTSNGNTSFQVSATAKGSLINVTGTGSFTGSCIRIIGDKPAEVTKACTTSTPPAMPAAPPILCAAKLDNSTVRVYLWDDANGHLGY